MHPAETTSAKLMSQTRTRAASLPIPESSLDDAALRRLPAQRLTLNTGAALGPLGPVAAAQKA